MSVGELHGLVGDGADAAVDEEPREPLVGGEVQVREQDVVGAEALVLLGLRLLDLHDQVGGGEHRVGVGHGSRAPAATYCVVGDRGADAGAGLHDDVVAGGGQLADPLGGRGDPVLVVLDLGRDPDPHPAHLEIVERGVEAGRPARRPRRR